MSKDKERHLADAISAFIIAAGLIGVLAFIDLVKKDTPVTDIKEAIVFSRALTDSPAYKQCAKKNLRTIKEFKGCLKEKGAM